MVTWNMMQGVPPEPPDVDYEPVGEKMNDDDADKIWSMEQAKGEG